MTIIVNGISDPNTSYTSTEQTITSAALLTLAHGLGTVPFIIQCFVICRIAEIGYSIGDILMVDWGGLGADEGMSVVCDSTNIYIRFGVNANALSATNKTTGASAALTNANWSLIVKAIT